MRLTDWRGREYGVGDTILYPRTSGRSCEISEATVVDIWRTYYDYDNKWKRLNEGENPPERMHWDPDTRENVMRAVRSETRVKVQPNGRGSRQFDRTDYDYRPNAEGGYERVEIGIRPVILSIVENVTAVPSD